MLRFSLSTLLTLPLVLASGHAALVAAPLFVSLFYGVAAGCLLLYTLTAKSTETHLDLSSRPALVGLWGCWLSCFLVFVTIATARKVSADFHSWAYAYRMESLGYEKVLIETRRDSQGRIWFRSYRWER